MPRVVADDGHVLEANFSVEFDGNLAKIWLESRGGSASRQTWNRDYNVGLEALIRRLAMVGATLVSADLSTRATSGIEPAAKRLDLGLTYPVAITAFKPEDLRLLLGRAQATVGRRPGARGPGNRTRRICLSVEVPSMPDLAIESWLVTGHRHHAVPAAGRASGSATSSAQGLEADPRVRRAVERRAVELVSDHLVGRGWSAVDVSSSEPYDLLCIRGADELHVEVKGTRGLGRIVRLTANEVAHASSCALAAIAIVGEIVLIDDEVPLASGGVVAFRFPWIVHPSHLRPVTFTWEPPDEGVTCGP